MINHNSNRILIIHSIIENMSSILTINHWKAIFNNFDNKKDPRKLEFIYTRRVGIILISFIFAP